MICNSFETKFGQHINLATLTVLVGPNNAGKSQTLRDILSQVTSDELAHPLVLLDNYSTSLSDFDDYLVGVNQEPSKTSLGYTKFTGLDYGLSNLSTFEYPIDQLRGRAQPFIRQQLGRFHISFLNAASRLIVAQSGPSHESTDAAPASLLQALFSRPDVENELDHTFFATFGMHIKLDYSGMQNLCLRISPDFGTIPSDPRDAAPLMRAFPRLDEQGDGFRSFVGVVLSVLLTRDRLILIDEPEAFLHPEQARRLGRWLSDQSKQTTSQIVLASHNSHFLQGLLSANNTVTVLRLNRIGLETRFVKVESSTTDRLTSSPLLSSQRVVEGLFHRHVVVCEADTDRAVYQSVAARALQHSDTLFLNAQNKQTCADIAEVLGLAGTSVRVAVDFDIFNDGADLKKLLVALGMPEQQQAQMVESRDRIAASVDARVESEVLASACESLQELQGQMLAGDHTVQGFRSALSRIRQEATKWDYVKARGIDGLVGEAQQAARDAIESLALHGCHVVPVGELECWMELGTRRKNRWIVLALERIFAGQTDPGLTEFVQKLIQGRPV